MAEIRKEVRLRSRASFGETASASPQFDVGERVRACLAVAHAKRERRLAGRQGFEPSQCKSLTGDGVALLANETRCNTLWVTSDLHCDPLGTPAMRLSLGNIVATDWPPIVRPIEGVSTDIVVLVIEDRPTIQASGIG